MRFDLSQLMHLTTLLPLSDVPHDDQQQLLLHNSNHQYLELNDTYLTVQQFIKDSGFNDAYVSISIEADCTAIVGVMHHPML